MECTLSSHAVAALTSMGGLVDVQESIGACRHSCRATQDCNAWVYCWRPGGCDDGREFHPDWYPYQVARAPALILTTSGM